VLLTRRKQDRNLPGEQKRRVTLNPDKIATGNW